MYSIDDVAKEAGVSVRTVSRMLSGHQVREETRRLVEAAMQKLDYVPSAAARSLRGKNTATLGVISDHLTTTPHAFNIVEGIRFECDARDTILMIGETNGTNSAFEKLAHRFRQQRTSGMIFATDFFRDVSINSLPKDYPIVLLNCMERDRRHAAIVPDDEKGAVNAAKELLRLGHRRIALIGLAEKMMATRRRKKGYKKALRAAGVPVDDALIVTGINLEKDDEMADLPAVLKSLFALGDPPTAIMCGNDKMALRLYGLLRTQLKLRVPDDVSIVGYDDYRVISTNLVPTLTTVSLPYFEMGREAARMALNGEVTPVIKKISCDLIVRESAVALVK